MIKLLIIFFVIIITYTITKYILLNQERKACNKNYYLSIKREKNKSKNLTPLKYECDFCNFNSSMNNNFTNSISKLGDYY